MKAYRKAVAAFAWSFVAAIGSNLIDGALTTTEALAALGIALVATAGVYASKPNVPNR
jgi:hypothetical protein